MMDNQNEPSTFEDHFSKQSQLYAQHRPQYPDELFAYLASLTPGRSLAWDCGTGNGQAAVGLAKYFEHVHASDASAEQIARAQAHEKIDYQVAPAEHAALDNNSTDLVTVAVAVHWFSFEEFYSEVRRVLKPEGILAVWRYSFTEISPEVDSVVRTYYYDTLRGCWPERIHYLEKRYETLPFPFEEIAPPSFAMERKLTLAQYAGFLDSWSATQRYKEQKGHHPLGVIWEQLSAAWGREEELRLVRWPLYFRIGRKSPLV